MLDNLGSFNEDDKKSIAKDVLEKGLAFPPSEDYWVVKGTVLRVNHFEKKLLVAF